MDAVLTQDAVLHFLQSSGGSVKNADLLLHFRPFLRDHAERDRNRELFKKFVNSVATVRQTDGVSFVVLRKKFRGHVPGGGAEGGTSGAPRLHAGANGQRTPENAHRSPGTSTEKPRQKPEETTPAPSGETALKTSLPAAGIMLNNNNNVEAKPNPRQQQVRSSPVQVETRVQERTGAAPLHSTKLGQQRASSGPGTGQPEEDEEEEEEVLARPGSAGGAWPLNVPLSDAQRAMSASSPCVVDPPAPSSSSSGKKLPQIYVEDMEALTPRGRSSEPGPGPRPGSGSPRQATEAPSRHNVQPEGVQVEPRRGSHPGLSSGHGSIFSPSSDASFSSSDWPPSGSPRTSRWNSSSEDLQARAGERVGVAKTHDAFQRVQAAHPESAMRRGDGKTTIPWHHSTGNLLDDQKPPARSSPLHRSTDQLHDEQKFAARVMPWHLSTGDLCDDREDAQSSDGSASSPQVRQRPTVARRVSSRLRSRMCRSMGADLDQLLQEEAGGVRGGPGSSEAARLNRLHRISSSLSLRYNLSTSSLSSCSTPPRCGSISSLVDVSEKGDVRRSLPITSSPAHHEGRSRQSLVPLEPREHAWLVKGAAGAWPDIYSLFREDSSLLNKRDFISGFTVLHWIAKHGDHRVLNTLWYGVEKAGLAFDVNAKATSGHTPLHVAAIHGNRNIIRLLVGKFSADVRLRDTAGKRPWQYLSRTAPLDIFQLLGAPARAAVTGEGGVQRGDSSWEQQQQHQQQQRRRRRHHLSSASGQRPQTYTDAAKVKRSTSIAAFLKHKSLHRFHGHQSGSPL
ncbi:ankyrin repeat domain-containing protein SOWAHA [Stegastes partitus]|uniref:Ankyrin repeat domain-containing protein SOWAHA n=1 Tax=Stegastes partitus TaxID=144197 RepID=A0A9Y4TX54_9TELE|nr:PREDICTED: ankyrin repeat domain-containing protein SOWAHA-like [Stegastes partitus]